ncbi:hypothetical protein BBJ28_00009804 [Nothophytophthora sp. Chile5]|nr:hypothetical protein BBJ28_00009804 [Nothophytophthora sp. Chile5]
MENASTHALAQLPQHSLQVGVVLTLALMYMGNKLLGPSLLSTFMRWHYALAAETPRLLYRATPANKKLLSHCTTITQKKYHPPWFLFNGHLQTVRFANETQAPEIAYKRQLLDTPDGGVVSLDWALLPDHSPTNVATEVGDTPPTSSSWLPDVDPSKRTVILLPGLTGGSPEVYIRRTIARLHELGWQCVVLNARGCADTPVKTAQLFCCAYTDDLRFVLKKLTEKYDFAHEAFVGVGFSMGSNVLVKYLGEEGESAPLTGAISVGNPFDLVKCSANFGGSLFNRLTYDKALSSNLRALFFENGYPGVDLEAVKASRTVRDFDDQLTKIAFRYETVDHYYEDASSVKKLCDVRVPLLCINAEDDPISISSALPSPAEVEANPNVILCVTKSGGHLAFYESPSQESGGQSKSKGGEQSMSMWTVDPIAEFAEAVRLSEVKTA